MGGIERGHRIDQLLNSRVKQNHAVSRGDCFDFRIHRRIPVANTHLVIRADDIRREIDAFGPGDLVDDATLLVLAAEGEAGRSD